MLKMELNVIEFKGIVLDGLFCQLKLKDKNLEWNINESLNKPMIELIEFLRIKATQ